MCRHLLAASSRASSSYMDIDYILQEPIVWYDDIERLYVLLAFCDGHQPIPLTAGILDN